MTKHNNNNSINKKTSNNNYSNNTNIIVDADSKAYEYLLQLYTSEHDLFWSRINYYIIIETVLLTLVVTGMATWNNWALLTILVDFGLVLTGFIFAAALSDYVRLIDYVDELAIIEPKVTGNTKIFRTMQEKRKKSKGKFASKRVTALFRWINGQGIGSLEVIMLILVVLVIVWLAIVGLHASSNDSFMTIFVGNGSR